MLARRGFLGSLAAVSLAGLAGCESCKKAGSGKPQVAVSIFPLWDLARRIGGEALDVALVLPAGRTEHAYDPTPKEVQKLAQAKLVVRVGLDLDDWAVKIVQGATGSAVTALELGPKAQPLPMGKDHVGEDEAHEGKGDDDDHHGANDPHFWLDPVRTKGVLPAIAEAFGKLLPAEQKGFDARRAEVEKSLGRPARPRRRRAEGVDQALDRHLPRLVRVLRRAVRPHHRRRARAVPRQGAHLEVPRRRARGDQAVQAGGAVLEPQLDKRPATVVAEQAKIPLFELDPVGGVGALDSYEKLLDGNAAVLAKALA
ncbi:MAG: zinc ABC transporter substrate-binding protein [Myxococcales bacterium]|nr:zinc ABC transporter substrate-binding protein [Myxococcales bacterium]